MECSNPLALDDPFLAQFTDLDTLLDPSILSLITNDELVGFEAVSSPSEPSLTSCSSPSTSLDLPTTPHDLSTAPHDLHAVPHDLSRKRSSDEDVPVPVKVVKDSKYVDKRSRNNIASRVSRSKKRTKVKSLFEREKELKVVNARLREEVEELTQETVRLRALLVNKLAH